MEAATVDKIVALAPANELEIAGLTFTDKKIYLADLPHIAPFQVCSLTAVIDLLEAHPDDFDPANYLLHVTSERRVELRARRSDKYAHRSSFIVPSPVERDMNFKFGTFYPQEEFAIALQALFVPSEDLSHVAKVASSLDAQDSVKQEDDGVTQRATVKSGIALSSEVVVKRRVTLAPFRTFLEVDQPFSDFIFRVKTTPAGASCALFEADGGAWKITAIHRVAAWLTNALHGSSLEGLQDLPVIA
jgi:hypothetical protein